MEGQVTFNKRSYRKKKSNKPTYNVQFGCGLCAPSDWTNFDVSPTLRLRRIPIIGKLLPSGPFGEFPKNVLYGNIIKGLPVQPGTIDNLYCSHVLEHLALQDFRTALSQCYKLMKKGGTFRFVLPDLERYAQEYVAANDAEASINFMRNTYLGRETRAKGIRGFLREWMGNSKHLWMWDFKNMKRELEMVGFHSVRRAHYNDSEQKAFRSVEEFRRWDRELGLECKK